MTEKTDALVPVEQKQVLFYEDTITAVRTSDNIILFRCAHYVNDLALLGQRNADASIVILSYPK